LEMTELTVVCLCPQTQGAGYGSIEGAPTESPKECAD
jgi:hypothetical protein